jgi:hypothetical protein
VDGLICLQWSYRFMHMKWNYQHVHSQKGNDKRDNFTANFRLISKN